MNDKKDEKPGSWPVKAYQNTEFLASRDGRAVRILCEFQEPEARFRKLNVRRTVVFFGSARTLTPESAEANLQSARKALKRQKGQAHEELECAYEEAKRDVAMARYYRDAALLAEKITGWSLGLPPAQRFIVCSGGGPGIMAAASEGARRAGGISIGLNISLPFEQKPNPFQTRKYTFEFHYFFIRKFWFFYLARAFVVFPGGFGTCDELFEVLTLIQTRKTSKHMPVVMFGSSFWKEVIHFDAMVKWGVIDRDDLNLFQFADSVDDAFEYLKNELGRY
jgi:uncharacterized protein (TIGR00730 family)